MSADEAVIPDAARPPATPVRTSIRYWSAPAVAAPPGTTLESELPASCDVPTTNQLRVPTAIRWSAQVERKLAQMKPIEPISQTGLRSSTSRHEVNTSRRLGMRM